MLKKSTTYLSAVEKNRVIMIAVSVLFQIQFVNPLFGQCEDPPLAVIDYCNNQYGEIIIDDPDDSNRYQWFSDASGNSSLGYGELGDGKHFSSPTTLSSGDGIQSFWYQKQTAGVKLGQESTAFNGATPGNGGGTTSTILVDSDFDFILNSITVPLHFWGTPPANESFGIKISMGGTVSNWYYYTLADLTSGGTNIWFLTIPIDVNGLGQGIPVDAATGIELFGFSESDGTELAGTTFLEFAVLNPGDLTDTHVYGTGGSSLTIHQNSDDRTDWPAGRFGFFDWDITTKCPLKEINIKEQTDLSQCCTPIGNVPTLATNSGNDIFELPISGNISVDNANNSHYFKWYKDGQVVSEGTGLTSLSIDDLGKYHVKIAELERDIDKVSCNQSSQLKKIRSKKLYTTPIDTQRVCLGDAIALSSTGGISDWQWSDENNGAFSSPTVASTSWTPSGLGIHQAKLEAMVPEGELIVNGDFEDGNTGFDVSSRMREAPQTDAVTGNVAGCGDGEILVFRDYGISGNGNGVFTIGNTPPLQDVWCFDGVMEDHTSGTGNFFMMDGLTATGWEDLVFEDNFIWQQKVVVEKNTEYTFSTWIASMQANGDAPPIIQFYIDGKPIQITDDLTYSPTWDQVTGTWNSGNYDGEITLSILNAKNVDGGNDFAMDDVSFSSGNALQTSFVNAIVEDCSTPCDTAVLSNFSDTTICSPASLQFNIDADLYQSIDWTHTGAGMLTSTDELSPSYEVNELDRGKTIFLIATANSKGNCPDVSDSISIQISALVPQDFLPDSTVCIGENLVYEIPLNVDYSSIKWRKENTVIDSLSNQITATEEGIYSVEISDELNCSISDSASFLVNQLGELEVGENVFLCAPDTIRINPVVVNSDSFQLQTNGLGLLLNETDGYYYIPDNSEVNTEIQFYGNSFTSGVCPDVKDTSSLQISSTLQLPIPNDTVLCEGDSFTITIPLSPLDYSIKWLIPGSNDTTLSPSILIESEGTYHVFVSSNLGCSFEDSISVSIENIPTLSLSEDVSQCNLDSIPVSILDSSNLQLIEWSHSGNGAFNEESLIYTPVQTDAGNTITIIATGSSSDICPVSKDTFVVEILEELNLILPEDTVLCEGDSFTITIPLDSNDYSIQWLIPGNIDSIQSPSILIENEGTYHVFVSSNFGCLFEDSISVFFEKIPTLSLSDDVSQCSLDSIPVSILDSSNIQLIEWSHSGDGVFNEESLSYTPVQTDAGNTITIIATGSSSDICPVSRDTFVVDILEKLEIKLIEDTVLCQSNSIQLTVPSTLSSFEIDWFKNDSILATNQDAVQIDSSGIYSIFIQHPTDSLCSATDSVEILFEKEPTLQLSEDLIFCEPDTARFELVVENSTTINWQQNGTGDLIEDESFYVAAITDQGTTVSIIATATSGIACPASIDTIQFIFLEELTLDLGNDTTLCENESLELTVPIEYASFKISWFLNEVLIDSNKVSITAQTQGEYQATLRHPQQSSCFVEDKRTLDVQLAPTLDIKNSIELCNAEQISFPFSSENTTDILWESSETGILTQVDSFLQFTPEASPNEQIIYIIGTTNSAVSCPEQKDTFSLTIYAPFSVDLPDEITLCLNDIASLSADLDDSYSFVWLDENDNTVGTQSNLSASTEGLFHLEVTSKDGCLQQDSIEIFIDLPPSIQLPEDLTICDAYNASFAFIAENETSIVWESTGKGNLSNAPDSVRYTPETDDLNTAVLIIATAIGSSNCPNAIDSIHLNYEKPLEFSIDSKEICFGESTEFQIVSIATIPPTPFDWFKDSVSTSSIYLGNSISFDSPESDTVFWVQPARGCFKDRLKVELTVNPVPVADFEIQPEKITELFTVVEISDLSEGHTSGEWQINSFNSFPLNLSEIVIDSFQLDLPVNQSDYQVSLTVENEFSCTNSINKTIPIKLDWGIHIPNAFSPNNDDINDVFLTKYYGIIDYEMRIFNRWGDLIFVSKDPILGWDGEDYNTEDLQARKQTSRKIDTYVYQVLVSDIFGEEHFFTGKVNLLR